MNNKCIRCGNDLVIGQNFCNCCGLSITNMLNNTNINYNMNSNSNINSNTGKLIIGREKEFLWLCS